MSYVGGASYASNDSLSQIQFGAAGSPLATEAVALDQGLQTGWQQVTGITVNIAGTTHSR